MTHTPKLSFVAVVVFVMLFINGKVRGYPSAEGVARIRPDASTVAVRDHLLYQLLLEALLENQQSNTDRRLDQQHEIRNAEPQVDQLDENLEDLANLEGLLRDQKKQRVWMNTLPQIRTQDLGSDASAYQAPDAGSRPAAAGYEVRDARADEAKTAQELDKKEAMDKDARTQLLAAVIQSLQDDPEQLQQLEGCSVAQPCGNDEYCYETPSKSECLRCLERGTECIDDAQCCSSDGSGDLADGLCVSGVCQTGVKPGTVGTLCEIPDDCDEGLCCTESPGLLKRMCKPLSGFGEPCSALIEISDGVFIADGYFNSACPCQDGLQCKRSKSSNDVDGQRAQEIAIRNQMVCDVPSASLADFARRQSNRKPKSPDVIRPLM